MGSRVLYHVKGIGDEGKGVDGITWRCLSVLEANCAVKPEAIFKEAANTHQ